MMMLMMIMLRMNVTKMMVMITIMILIRDMVTCHHQCLAAKKSDCDNDDDERR